MAQRPLEQVDLDPVLQALHIAGVEEGGHGQHDDERPAQPAAEALEPSARRAGDRLHQGQCPVAGEDAHGKAKQIDNPLLVPHGAKPRRQQVGQVVEECVDAEGQQQGHGADGQPEDHLAPRRFQKEGRTNQDQRQYPHVLGRSAKVAGVEEVGELVQAKAGGDSVVIEAGAGRVGDELPGGPQLDRGQRDGDRKQNEQWQGMACDLTERRPPTTGRRGFLPSEGGDRPPTDEIPPSEGGDRPPEIVRTPEWHTRHTGPSGGGPPATRRPGPPPPGGSAASAVSRRMPGRGRRGPAAARSQSPGW